MRHIGAALTARRREPVTAVIAPIPGDPLPLLPNQTYTLDATTEFRNPERGWYAFSNLITWRSFDVISNRGFNLAHSYIRLDDFRTAPISQALINDLRAGLTALRASNSVKVVLRFAYNFGPTGDAPFDWVIHHINQLAPTLHDFQDVIPILQAGFIGAWGEWHASTNNLIDNVTFRHGIMDALLANTPNTMMVEFRYPAYIMHRWGATPLAHSQRFSGTPQARTAHHNDCIGAGETMGDTYSDWRGPWPATQVRAFAAAIGRYCSFGGETCDISGLTQWSAGPYILEQMELLGLDYLNRDFWLPMLEEWRIGSEIATLGRRMGYRFGLVSANAPTQVARGSVMQVSLRIRNDGYGKLYHPRPLDIVFTGPSGEVAVRSMTDCRLQMPLAGEEVTVQAQITVPQMATGSHAIHLKLPDRSANLQRPLDCIRLANVGLWDATRGHNNLNLTVNIT